MNSTHPHPLFASVVSCLLFLSGSPEACSQVLECFAEPIESVEISTPIQGTLSKLYYKLGDRVRRGDLLAEINHTVLVESRKLAEAKANAHSRIDAVQIEIELEQKRLEKLEKLRASGNASKNEIENSLAKISSLRKKKEAAEEERAIHRMDVERIQAEIELRMIKSPITGTIVKIHPAEGEFVSASEPGIARIVNLNRLKTKFFVTPGQSQFLKKKGNCQVVVSNGEKVSAQIDFHSPITSAESGTVEIHLSFDNTQGKCRAGDSVRLMIDSEQVTRTDWKGSKVWAGTKTSEGSDN